MPDLGGSCPDFEGNHHVHWVEDYLGECVYTDLELISVFVGFSSIGCWLVAQIPQILINFKLKTAHSLSFFFLLQWFLGDTTNLIGCILSNQNVTQTFTAIYFVFMDIVLFSQYLYFQYIRPRCIKGYKKVPENIEDVTQETSNGTYFNAILLTVAILGCLPFGMLNTNYGHPTGGRILLNNKEEQDKTEYLAGTVIGWVSAALYLGSRIPQIIKNFKRRSTEGLSPLMFTMAVMGNVTYSASIFMYSVEKQYIIDRLPWIVGSAGTLCFDFTTLTQFFLYRHNKTDLTKKSKDPEDQQLLLHSNVELYKPKPRNPRQAYYHRIGIGWQGN